METSRLNLDLAEEVRWGEHDATPLKLTLDRGLPVVNPEDRVLVISRGAALFYLRIDMRRFGYEEEVEGFSALCC